MVGWRKKQGFLHTEMKKNLKNELIFSFNNLK